MNPWDLEPVANVKWVPLEKVSPNDYNPNAVARNEMKLLYLSILNDGFTQPIVTVKSSSYIMKVPCGEISLHDIGDKLCSYLEDLSQQSLLTPLVRLKEMGVSQLIDAQIDIQLELVRGKTIKEKNGVNGSKNNGDLDLFKEIKQLEKVTGVTLSFGTGTLPDLIKLNSYLLVFCPTCLSKEKKHWKRWSIFIQEPTALTKGVGMILKCNL